VRVRGVVTRDTGRALDDLLNAAAEHHGFDAVGFLGGLIAESNLDEHSARLGVWPDVSFGLAHPAVTWLDRGDVPGLTPDPADPRTNADTHDNRTEARAYLWDAANSIAYAAPRYATLLVTWGDPLAAWCRWNKPNVDPALNPNRRNYERGQEAARAYAATEEEPPMPATHTFVIGPGFQQRIDDLGLEPKSDETYFAPGLSVVLTDKGPLWYAQASNEVLGPFGEAP
jgi:hypothetical protein